MLPRFRGLQRWLERAPVRWFSAYCILAAFGTYFCMYAFRKPFTAGTFEGTVFGGVALKTLLIGSQVCGYTLSKFIGIRVVSEMRAAWRGVVLLALIGVAELALLLFAVTPSPWNAVWLFVNGLPLGMVFGLVLAFLEGRRQTEALTAGLCASFILASGVVKWVGRSLIVTHGVDEVWMPFTTGLLFVVPLALFVVLLSHVPPPNDADVAHRSGRAPMSGQDRRQFFRRHAVGLVGLVATYLLLTVGRSIRDDFAVEIWRDLGTTGQPAVFARTELLVMIAVLLINGLAVRVRSNRRAFLGALGLSIGGFLLLVVSVVLQRLDALDPFVFMVLSGVGLYVPYVAFHTTIFERLIAAFRERANIGYLMYLADAFGYLGYVGVMVARNLWSSSSGTAGAAADEQTFLQLYLVASVVVAGLSTAATLAVGLHFARRLPAKGAALPAPGAKGV